MAEPLRVETPSADLAQALMHRLSAFPTELAQRDGRCDVEVGLTGNPDRAVVEILNRVDRWLLESGLESVRVHLDGRTYTLTPPVG